ncbi:hypothetical protein N9327_00240 [Candidatus Pelagibacter sp.]|nr:hypothetical protein [Candidatus Pelagibacter sp.]
MKTVEKNIDLLKFRHFRETGCKITANQIFNLINNYTDQQELVKLYNYFEKKYNLPTSVVKQSFRQYLARSYLMKRGKFNSKLKLRNVPRFLLRYGALIYALFFFKVRKRVKKFKLIIDNITSALELKRFEKLLNLFGSDNVLCVTRDINIKKDFLKYHFYNKKILRDINLSDLLKCIFNEFFYGIWVVLKISIKTKVNLFPISLEIIHSYLSFKSLFEENKAEFIIQGKHYDTEPIKNHLFKKFGGTASTSIQKNILQIDPIFFYIDIDILLSLGDDGYNKFKEYGGRIDHIKPVGSLFMEYSYFNFNKEKENIKKYDIAILGINSSNGYERFDSYNKFMDDYYSLYRWAAKLSIEKPEINIVSIHHASAGEDKIEDDILENSRIKTLDKNLNSYETAFSSKFAITYGSTMAHELNGHGLPTFFIDPEYRSSFLPDKGTKYIDNMRIDNYDSLNLLTKEIIDKKKLENIIIENSNMWCLKSFDVSNKIYNYLINQKK